MLKKIGNCSGWVCIHVAVNLTLVGETKPLSALTVLQPASPSILPVPHYFIQYCISGVYYADTDSGLCTYL